MEITIAAHELTIKPELRAWVEKQFEILSSRFGPIETARIVIRRGGFTEPWKVTASILAFDTELRPRITADDLQVAFDELLVVAAGRLRSVKWEKFGIAAKCRWCDGEEFLHLRHPLQAGAPMHLANDGGQQRGRLEALVCRGCGHVEWFVSDPGRIPTKNGDVSIVRARPAPDPYRG
jgi:ribosome-associated translation inhibitor RaiA